MENFLQIPKQNKDYSSLKESFINGNISFEETRNRLLEWDQQTSLHAAADENLFFLRDKDIINKINQGSPQQQEGFRRFLSFTEFHVAQRIALNISQEESLAHFIEALELSFDSDKSWKSYLEGTLLYMKGLQISESIIDSVEQPKNKEILKNLNNRLKERGFPLYKEDLFI